MLENMLGSFGGISWKTRISGCALGGSDKRLELDKRFNWPIIDFGKGSLLCNCANFTNEVETKKRSCSSDSRTTCMNQHSTCCVLARVKYTFRRMKTNSAEQQQLMGDALAPVYTYQNKLDLLAMKCGVCYWLS